MTGGTNALNEYTGRDDTREKQTKAEEKLLRCCAADELNSSHVNNICQHAHTRTHTKTTSCDLNIIVR